jgi:cardiolipin synthase A/B
MNRFVSGNHVSLLRNGIEYFPALISAIQAAKHEIYLQTYIYELDQTGEAVSDALIKAALRGVYVFLMLDGFGCRHISKEHIANMRQSGVNVMFFRPKVSPWTLKRSRLRRMHSKLTVIDGTIGFVGGINIIDDFNTPSHTPPRIDYAVKIEGPVLKNMHASAKSLWKRVCRSQLVKLKKSQLQVEYDKHASEDMHAAFLIRDNFKHRRDIENAYLSAIESAQSEIIIANAYFLPGLRFRHALRDAVLRGVKVTLLLQKRTEYILLDFATRALYSALLKQGIHIHEYHKSFMHSKVAVIDDRFAIIGSSNIDPFSLFLAIEANIIVENQHFSDQLRQSLLNAINDGSTVITIDEWQHHYYVKRFISWLVYGLAKLMVGIAGYPENT